MAVGAVGAAGYAAYAAMAAATIYSVYSSQQAGKQAQLNANAQAEQAQADADTEKSAAVVQAERIRRLARIQAGEANAALAGSGVEVGEGTALNINEEIYQNAEEDAVLTIMSGKNKAQRLDGDASNYRLAGSQAKSAANSQAIGSVMSMGSSMASGWKSSAGGGVNMQGAAEAADNQPGIREEHVMAQIPMGNFGRMVPAPEQGRVITPNPGTLDRGGQAIARGIENIGAAIFDAQAKQAQEDQALAKVKASNALIDRESQLKSIVSDLDEKMRTGQLDYTKAESVYADTVSKLDPLDTPGLDEVTMGEIGNSLKRMQMGGVDRIRAAASGARIESAKADLVSRMDMLGKDAALPDANIDQINARMDAEDIDVAGRLAFGEAWVNKKQEFKDSNWTTHATQRVIGARDGLQSLKQIENDLTAEDGFYAKKLDPEKRNQLLNTVTGRIFQVQEHQQRQAEMREMKAMRALDQMDKQAASGLPPTPADQQRWQATLAGTSLAPEFNARMGEMVEVQQLLRQPLAVQSQYLEKKRQQMAQNGGSVADQANVERLQRAVDSNTQLMREQPLLFNAQRTGADVPPLDLSGITSPEGQQQIADQLATRFDTVNALRKQYGPEVARNPWRPEEAAMLKSFVSQADDGTKLQLLGALAAAAPSGSDYAESLKAIAADQPAVMLAGMAQFRGLRGADGTDVPKVLLAGSRVLADKSTPMPSESDLRNQFDEKVGGSIPSGTPQREQAFIAFKSLYAGLSDAGAVRYDPVTKVLDDTVLERALTMATGGVGEHAGAKVIKPYGMDDKTFTKAVDEQLEALTQRTGFLYRELEDMPLSPVPGKEGAYYLMNAGRVQLDPTTQQPMTVIIK